MEDDNEKRRQSVLENVQKLEGKSTKRRSIFEKSDETSLDKENADSYLEEWNQRWGKHGYDFVNVLKYPEGYMQKIKTEKQMWITGLKEMMKRAEEFGNCSDNVEVVEGCELSSDQKVILQGIDSKISKCIDTCKSQLASLEISKNIRESNWDHINKEIELVEKLVMFKNK